MKLKEKKNNRNESPIFSKDVDTENVLVSSKIYSNKKNINNLLFTRKMTIKLIHYT